MVTEDRGYSNLYRNSTEELFIKTLMEGSAGLPVPTMDMLGFKNLSQNFRADSEELFNSWLTNGENQVNNSAGTAHRTRQASRRFVTLNAYFFVSPEEVCIYHLSFTIINPHTLTFTLSDFILFCYIFVLILRCPS